MFYLECYDQYGNPITRMTQWDLNQKLYIMEHNFTTAPSFHFCNKNTELALVVRSKFSGNTLVVDVPNQLLIEPYPITVYVYLSESDKSSKTVEVINIPITPRQKPDDFEYKDNIEVIKLTDLEKEIKELNARITEAEEIRIANENARVLAENKRIASETQRDKDEKIRNTNENTRVENENTRIENENNRKKSETDRAIAENARSIAETKRDEAESTRNSNEETRKENESDRCTAEDERNESENTRTSNEDERISNENTRKTNETNRESQEKERQKNTTTAITKANTATTRANTAAKDCEDIVNGLNETVNKAVSDSLGYAELSEQYSKQCTDTLEEINKKMALATFDLDENGNLIYTDDSAYAFSVTDDGNLNWSVS